MKRKRQRTIHARAPAPAPPSLAKGLWWRLRERVAGLALACGCLAGLTWTVSTFQAHYHFRTLDEPQGSKPLDLAPYRLELEGLLRLDPTNGAIRNRYASVLALLGDRRQALEQLRLAQRTLNQQDSLQFIANVRQKQGDLDGALEAMRDCIHINPHDPQLQQEWLRLLHLWMENHPFTPERREAYAEMRRQSAQATRNYAIRAPFDPNAYLFLGNHYTYLGVGPLAYRCYLVGLSEGVDWTGFIQRRMIRREAVWRAIRDLLDKRLARPYRGLQP